MKPEHSLESNLTPMAKPPSVVLKAYFYTVSTYPPSESELCTLSEKVMLPVEEVNIWLEHLHTIRENRQKGRQRLQ